MTPSGVVTPTGAVAPGGFPAAAGGVDVSGALTSVVPGIRKLKKIAVSKEIKKAGGLVQLELPKASYMEKAVIKITGTLTAKGGEAKKEIEKSADARLFINRFEFALSGSTSPRVLSGIQSDIIDGLDLPAVAPNNQLWNAPAEPGIAEEKSTPFEIEMSPFFVVSPQNLYGIPYLGAPSTVPQFNITFGNPNGTLAKFKAASTGQEIFLASGMVEVEMWRIDLPAPVAPKLVQSVQNGQTVTSEVPGQGLYQESGMMILSRMYEEQKPSKNGTKLFQLPIGPDYMRIIVLVFTESGVLDPETTPLLAKAELSVQQATVIESKKIWQFDNEYRHLFNKARPKGVYVFSGIDETGTDADLYVTRELGNFDLEVFMSEAAPGESAVIQVITQELVPLSEPGLYL
jgi:hypothetical protein